MKKFEQISEKYVFPLFLGTILCVIFWSLNKGFDLTDEGYYLLGLVSDQDNGIDLSNYHVIVKKFFFWVHLNILNVRIIRLILTLLSTFVLTYSIRKSFDIKASALYVFSIIGIFSFASYGFGPQSLSYNTLLSNLMIIGLGFLLLGTSQSYLPAKKRTNYYLLATGFILGLAILTKLTSGFVGAFVFVVYILLHKNKPQRLWWVLSLLAGLGVGFLWYFIFCQSISAYYHSILTGVSFVGSSGGSGYGVSSLFISIYDLVLEILDVLGVLSLLILSYFLIEYRVKHKIFKGALLSIIAIGFLVYCFPFFEKQYLRSAFPYLFIPLSFLVYLLFSFLRDRKELILNKQFVYIIGLLFIMPFVIAFGSDNPLIYNSIFCLASWGAIVVILNNEYNFDGRFKWFFNYLFLLTITFLFCFQYIQTPYRLSPLNQQNYSLRKEGLKERIKLDEGTTKSIGKIKKHLEDNNFKSGDPIIGIYKLPGLIYLLDGRSPITPLSVWNEDRLDSYIHGLENSTEDYSESYVLIRKNYNNTITTKLNSVGINFPADFIEVANVYMPSIYAYLSGDIKIYVHKSKGNSKLGEAEEYSKQGMKLFNAGNYEVCISLLNKAIEIRPNNASDLNNLGMAYLRLNQPSKAVESFERALISDPNYNLAKNNLKWAKSLINLE